MPEDPDDSVFFGRDYSNLWQPPPLPRRPPWGNWILLAVVLGLALALSMAQ